MISLEFQLLFILAPAAKPPVSMYRSKKQDTTSQKKVSQLKTNGNGGSALHVTASGRHENLARNQISFP